MYYMNTILPNLVYPGALLLLLRPYAVSLVSPNKSTNVLHCPPIDIPDAPSLHLLVYRSLPIIVPVLLSPQCKTREPKKLEGLLHM